MKYSKIFLVTSIVVFSLLSAACGGRLDVVGSDSARAFNDLLSASPGRVAPDPAAGGWSLSAPDGARFVWSADYSKSAPYDIMIEFAARPFIDAGLDSAKLPPGTLAGDKIRLGRKLGQEAISYSGQPTPLASYEQLIRLKRPTLGYHAALDHYGLDLGGGHLFEWAKDLAANDKDLVFALNPAPFIAAGADPAKISGWLLAKVPVDVDGKPAEVEKLLRIFNLK